MATKRLRILGSEEEYISSSMRYIRVINLGLICMAVIAVISLLLQNGFYLNHTFELRNKQ